jgi:hypothetical protein
LHDIEDPKYAGQRVSRRELQDGAGSSLDEADEASVDEGRGETSENESEQEPEEVITDPPSHSASESERAEREEPLAKSRVDDLKRAKAVKRQQVSVSHLYVISQSYNCRSCFGMPLWMLASECKKRSSKLTAFLL